VAEEIDELVTEVTDETGYWLRMGIRGGAIAVGVTLFSVVAELFCYMLCSVWVELKKFMWTWPSPYAHAMRDDEAQQRELPHQLQGELEHLRRERDSRRRSARGAASVSEAAPRAAPPVLQLMALAPPKAAPPVPQLMAPGMTRAESEEEDAGEPPSVDLLQTGKVGRSEVEPGDRFSFRYSRGERRYRKRTVRLIAWLANDKFQVYDEDVRAERHYYANETYDAHYIRTSKDGAVVPPEALAATPKSKPTEASHQDQPQERRRTAAGGSAVGCFDGLRQMGRSERREDDSVSGAAKYEKGGRAVAEKGGPAPPPLRRGRRSCPSPTLPRARWTPRLSA
jgi:hypothetical protein